MKKQVTIILLVGIIILMSLFVIGVFSFKSSNAVSEEDSSGKIISNANSQALSNCGEPVVYSAENFIDVTICTEYEEGKCSNNLITCYVDVVNLDDSTAGIFEIGFDFFDEGNSIVHSDSEEFSLAPKEKKTFQASYNAKGDDAEKKITCSYKTIKIPDEIC